MANGNIPPPPPGFTLDQPVSGLQPGEIPPPPPGFTLDQIPPPPPGFTLDQPGAVQQPVAVEAPGQPQTPAQEASQTPLTTISDIEKAFQDIPGAPALSELAQSVNRSVLGTIDFLGPDTINAALQLSGSDKRVPTLTETILGEQQDFLEPGFTREAIRAAGPAATASLGIGQALRTAASRLPAATGGEGVLTGVARQFGQATPRQDIALGAISGVGQEAGREVAGEEGATVGGIVAPIAAVPIVAAKETAKRLIREATPSIDQLKNTARGIYQSLDDAGTTIPAQQFDELSENIIATLNREGADINLTPQTNAVIARLANEQGTSKTLTNMDTLRKVAKGAADSSDRNESRLGTIAVQQIDSFLDDLSDDVVTSAGVPAGQAFRSARQLWQRAAKAEQIEQAVTQAENVASGFENGIRIELRKIIRGINKGKIKGYTPEEKRALEKVVQGTKASNVAKFLGKFGVLDGVTSRTLTTVSGAGAAGLAAGVPGLVAVPAIGQVSGALAQRLTLNNARMASQIVRAGRNGAEIARVYLRNTPKDQRNASELAELFLSGRVPIDSVNLNTAKPIIADAAVIAAIARQNDERELREQPEQQPQAQAR